MRDKYLSSLTKHKNLKIQTRAVYVICIASFYSLNSFGQIPGEKKCYQSLSKNLQLKHWQDADVWITSTKLHDHFEAWTNYLECIQRSKKVIESETTNIEENLQKLYKDL